MSKWATTIKDNNPLFTILRPGINQRQKKNHHYCNGIISRDFLLYIYDKNQRWLGGEVQQGTKGLP